MAMRTLYFLAYALTLAIMCAVPVRKVFGDEKDCTGPPPVPPSSCMGTTNCSGWLSEYKAWCVKNGGTPREDGTGCDNACKDKNGSSVSGTQNSSSSLANALTTAIVYGDAKTRLTAFGIIGTMFALNELLSDNKNPKETEGRIGPDNERLEIARRQAELERQRQWKKMLDELGGEMKPVGPPMAELHYKDISSPGGTNFFGSPANSSLQLKSIEGAGAATSFSDPMKQLSVGACLMGFAARAATEDEATFIRQQAERAMQGETVSVDTSSCAPPNAPPVEGHPVFSLSTEEKTFYKKLFDDTNHEVSVLADLSKKERDLTQKQQDLDKEIEKHKRDAEQIQQELQQIDQQPTPPPDPQAVEKKRSLLAEALAAEQAAEEDKGKNEAALSETKNEIEKVENAVKVNQDCMQQATSDPTKIASLSKSCGTQ